MWGGFGWYNGWAEYVTGGAGLGLALGALVFFPWNAIEPLHRWWLVGQAFISLVAGQFLGMALVALYHRVFDMKDV
jgi:hypothetical protein